MPVNVKKTCSVSECVAWRRLGDVLKPDPRRHATMTTLAAGQQMPMHFASEGEKTVGKTDPFTRGLRHANAHKHTL